MTLKELAHKMKRNIVMEYKATAPEGTWENPYRCRFEGVGVHGEWGSWESVRSAGKTMQEAWDNLAENARGRIVHLLRHDRKDANGRSISEGTFEIPTDLTP